MAVSDKELFENLEIDEQKKVEDFLKRTQSDQPNWLLPTDKDYNNVAFAFYTIAKFNGDVDFATETYNLALRKSQEATDNFIQKRKQEIENGEVLTLEDFNGHWGKYKKYLDGRYESDVAETNRLWHETFEKYFRDMSNPYTGEVIRLQ